MVAGEDRTGCKPWDREMKRVYQERGNDMKNALTIRSLMNKVPGNQSVVIRDYITSNTLETSDAESFVEFIRNDCCIDFDGDYEVYGIEVDGNALVVSVCPQEGIHYIEKPIYSVQPDEDGNYMVIGHRREYV